jgi:hypothetical protein
LPTIIGERLARCQEKLKIGEGLEGEGRDVIMTRVDDNYDEIQVG